MSGVMTSSLSLAWSLRKWVILEYESRYKCGSWLPLQTSRIPPKGEMIVMTRNGREIRCQVRYPQAGFSYDQQILSPSLSTFPSLSQLSSLPCWVRISSDGMVNVFLFFFHGSSLSSSWLLWHVFLTASGIIFNQLLAELFNAESKEVKKNKKTRKIMPT